MAEKPLTSEFCVVQATVPTGFESGAAEECREIFKTDAVSGRGKVTIPIKTKEDLPKLFAVRSIDHAHVVVKDSIQFCKDPSVALERLKSLPGELEWGRPLEVWQALQDVGSMMDTDNIKFRVTCHRTGPKLGFGSMDAAREFGSGVNLKFGWKVDLTHHSLEVVLNVDGTSACVLLTLTKQSQHLRNIVHFGPTVLRSTVCHGLLRLCHVSSGDVVLDPMCGGGSISIEGSLSWKDSFHLAGDLHDLAVSRTEKNMAAQPTPLKMDALQWDITSLPLRTASIDAVVTDMPFGKKMGSQFDNRKLYPAALREMGRVCRLDTGRAVLLTADNKSLGNALVKCNLWTRQRTYWANIGGIKAAVYVLRRTGRIV
jgi:23S rRNA G2445 N2-methylase RlmL